MPFLDQILSVAAPHTCVACGSEGALLCGWCAPDAFPGLPSRCFKCLQATTGNATCANCRRGAGLRNVWVVTDYSGTAKKLLHSYKFERAMAGAQIISQAMATTLPYMTTSPLIIPVPTATIRIRQRGYDHAALLARLIAQSTQNQSSRAVTRLTQSRQVGANREQRLEQLKNAFFVARPSLVKGKDILLVDDVVTTGATLEAVAAVLKKAGAKSISAVVFAQKH